MSLWDVLFSIVIFPVQQVIELCFYFTLRIFHNPGLAILGVSAAVSLLTLPIYFRAEYWQRLERETQRRLADKVKTIKAVFKGDERFMILSVYYRQNHYHPLYALRNSLGVLFQIPFFIAAYTYLAHLGALKGASFLFLRDLASSDGLLRAGNFSVNILPIAMTVINIVSGTVYTKGYPLKDKIQLYGMALIFLVLLYPSPSGLVLYWTANNVFSLLKNIFEKIRNARKIVWAALYAGIILADVYLLFFQPGDLPNRLLAMAIFSSLALLPFIPPLAARLCSRERGLPLRVYALSCGVLFLLLGLVIPSTVFSSSVEEFSHLGAYATPFPIIAQTALQSAGVFLFWALCLYFLFTDIVRQSLTLVMSILAALGLTQFFFIKESFGFLTNMLIFSEPKPVSVTDPALLASCLLVVLVPAVILTLYILKKRVLLTALSSICAAALLCITVVNFIAIHRDFLIAEAKRSEGGAELEKAFTLSKTGKNVLLIMLDTIPGAFIPYVFEERPDLIPDFSDFTYYHNTISYGNHTLVGALPIYGGYEYTPRAVNARSDVTLLDKQKEAYLLLPTLFADAGYQVTVTDPPFDNYQLSNLSIFMEDERIHASNITAGKSAIWLERHPDIETIDMAEFLYQRLIRFSFFKAAPLFLRPFFYDDGDWMFPGENRDSGGVSPRILNDYALLDLLPELTDYDGEGGTYTAVYSHLPHDTTYLQAPEYVPSNNVTNRGTSILKDDGRLHMTCAAFIMLDKWFDVMKEQGVYDNTRIILVSDHGRGNSPYPDNITLPNGEPLQKYNALLMVKDFDAKQTGAINSDETFMTNADAALFAVEGLFPGAANPFTGETLKAAKNGGADVAVIEALSTYRHSEYAYTIGDNEWLHVDTNIFDPANWSAPGSK